MPLNPFVYPNTRHRRRFDPPASSSYRKYKPLLREEFHFQCVYCRLPDSLKGDSAFGVDHYRPQSKFPTLSTIYANLFYACNTCNSLKRDFWPSRAQSRAGIFIPNPCDYLMVDHLRYRATLVEAKSKAGEFTEKALLLNDQRTVEYRRMVLAVITALEEKIRRVRESLKAIDQQATTYPDRGAELTEQKILTQSGLWELERYLEKLAGGSSSDSPGLRRKKKK